MYNRIKRKLLRKVVSDEVVTEQEELGLQETQSDKSLSEEEVEEEEKEAERDGAKNVSRKGSKSKKMVKESLRLKVPEGNTPAFIYENTDYIEGNDPLTRLQRQLEQVRGSRTFWISAPSLYHFYYDDKWKCGFRNIQILALAAKSSGRPEMEKRLFNGCGFIPDVASIQKWIELAWQRGWDPTGRKQYEGQLAGTRRWIGAVEVGVLFRSFGLRTHIVDFRTRSKTYASPNFYHKALVDFVWTYFMQGPSAALYLPRKFSFRLSKRRARDVLKMPIFLQQPGHSRTIVGVEETQDGIKNFIVFDPSQSGERMQIGDKYTRINVGSLRKSEYQLAFIHEIKNDSAIMLPKEHKRAKRFDRATLSLLI